jgi:DNA-binding MarR family transcriptional regulator
MWRMPCGATISSPECPHEAWITREQYGSRGIYAVITPKGLAKLKEAFPGHAQEVRRLFTGPLTPEQLDQLAGIATTILDNLKADEPSA